MSDIVLGCAETYSAAIHAQGGARLWAAAVPVQELAWSRLLDDCSEATVRVAKAGVPPDCCGRIADTRDWGHELSVYRDERLVWQGPVRKVIESAAGFTIVACDVFGWLDRRLNPTPFNYVDMDVVVLASQLIQSGLAPHDPAILDYLHISAAGVLGTRAAAADQVYIGAEIRELSRAGLDFTTMGRALLLSGELGDLSPRAVLLAGRDLLGGYEIERTGATVTRAVVVGEGVTGRAGGTDGFVGRLDLLVKADGTLDAASAAAQAQALVAHYAPPVTVLRLPDQSWLSPLAPIGMDELLCGNRIDVVTADMCMLPQRQAMRLTKVAVTWAGGSEQVAVSLAPWVSLDQSGLRARADTQGQVS